MCELQETHVTGMKDACEIRAKFMLNSCEIHFRLNYLNEL